MIETLPELLTNLPDYLGGHMLVSVVALGIGLAVSVPLGIWASKRPVVAEYLLGAAGILQTVPTLALLALMVPILGGTIGFAPAFVALTLYSFLPILANTVTGIRGIDPGLTEAARGLGMNDRQMLLRVQLPLAAPVILSGIRTATVLVVGTATLATPVGGKSLGNYIFAGMEMHNMTLTIFGCVLAALLAIAMDQLIHLYELALQRRSRPLAFGATLGLAVIVLGGLYGPACKLFDPAPTAIVGGATFTEQHILVELLAERLNKAGFHVDQRTSMGETIQFLALKHNRIDACVNYTGNVWTLLMKRDGQPDYPQIVDFLRTEYRVECVGKLGFQNAYALAIRAEDADRIQSIADLSHLGCSIGGDLQFFQRDEWTRVRQHYRLEKLKPIGLEPSLMYGAIKDRKVDVICAYSTDARLLKYKLKILDDPGRVFPSYDAILLLSEKGARNAALRDAVVSLASERLSDDMMRAANELVDVQGAMPRPAARKLMERLRDRELTHVQR